MRPIIQKTYVFLSVMILCLLAASVLQERAGTGTQTETPAPYLYVLREYDGKIALFAAEGTQPLYVFEKDAALLPEADRDAIRTGILIEDEVGLRQVMEDFFE